MELYLILLLFIFIFIILSSIFSPIILFLKKNSFKKKLEKICYKYNLKFDKEKNTLDDFIKGKRITLSLDSKTSLIDMKVYHNFDLNLNYNFQEETILLRINESISANDIEIYNDTSNIKSLIIERDLVALLNNKLRNHISKLSDNIDGFNIVELLLTNNNIIIKLRTGYFPSIIFEIIETAISICDNLNEKRSIKEQLIENVKYISDKKIRLHNLNYLINDFSNDKIVEEFLRSLLKDNEESIQIAAAKQLKDEGLNCLFNILQNQWKYKFINNLEVITFLGEKKYLDAMPLLMEIYIGTKDFELKKVILNSFKDFAAPTVSVFLVKELNNEEQKLREVAIKALGTCGNREAIEPLYKLNKSVINPITKNLIQEAIAKIQSRLGECDAGGLSIAEHTEKDGALSMANEQEEGGLSIAEKKDNSKKYLQKEEEV